MVAPDFFYLRQALVHGMLSLQAQPMGRQGKAVGPMSGTSSKRCQAVNRKAPVHGGPRR